MELFKATFEQAAVGIAHMDLDGRYLRVNPSLCDLLGYSTEDLLKRSWKDITHHDDLAADLILRNMLVAGEIPNCQMEKRYLRKDGTTVWAKLTLSIAKDSEGAYLYTLAVVQDITERKRVEAELAEAKRRLDFHLDNAPVAFVEWGEDFRVIRWSQGAESIFGWKAEEVIGKSFQEWRFVFEEDVDHINEEVQDLLSHRVSRQTVQNRNYRKNGTVIHCEWHNSMMFNEQGTAVSMLSIAHDISEKQHAEQALREREEQLNLFIEHAPAAIAMFDTEMRYLAVSNRFIEVYGLGDKDFLGRSHYEVFPEIPERWREIHRRCLNGAVERAVEDPFVRSDGRTQWIRWEIHPWYSASGKVGGILMLTEDVTASKLLKESLRQAKEKAERASQAKTEFLANMSHEIRTPMNGVIGMTELALLTCTEPRPREYLKMAKQSGKSLLFLINDVLDLSKIEAGKVELESRAFDLREELMAFFRAMAVSAQQKGLRFMHEVHSDVPKGVVGDCGRLRQVLTNLVGNAIKYTPHGSVEVIVRPADTPASKQGAVCVRFQVTDTGIGIPAEKLEAIFESFTQLRSSAHPDFGGTGLGLTISRELVHLMGGEIDVESKPGQGSTFSFTVELGLATKAVLPAERPEPKPGRIPRLKVLVAEDNEINRLVAEDLLEERGHRVKAVSNGQKALEALQREPFDLVLMDVRMPEMDGEEATRRIREGMVPGVPRDIPIVALTAYALAGDHERFLAAGMDDYLSKPISLDALESVLARVAAR